MNEDGTDPARSRGVLLNPEDDDQLDIRRVFSVLWTRAPLIIVLVVLAAGAAYGWSSLKTDQYQATSKVRVVDPNSEAIFDGANIRVDPKREVDTQIALLRSDDLRADVDQQVGEGARQITSVSMSGVGSTDLISITVTSPSPQVATDAANAFAEIYVEQRKEQVSSSFTERADTLRQQSAEIDQQITDVDVQLLADLGDSERAALNVKRAGLVAQQSDLQTRATQFDVEAAARTGNVEVAETATVPKVPVSPKPMRDAALAGILALLVGIGLAFLLDRLDDKVHDPGDVDAAAGGLPVIGVIPIDAKAKRGVRKLSKGMPRHLVALDSTAAESFRALRSNLRFSAVGSKLKTVLITSSESGEGKSTVAANLAVVLAESGLRVVLVSADLRKPSLASFFGIDETATGLTSVLMGDATMVEALVPVSLASGRTVYVLPAGPLPQNPAEVLGSHAMGELLQSLERAGADFVLVDSPPVLPVADALALSQFADGVLVLTLAGGTRRGHLTETLDRLQKVDAGVVGVVLNGVPTRGRYSRYYGGYTYGYRNSYQPDTRNADAPSVAVSASEHATGNGSAAAAPTNGASVPANGVSSADLPHRVAGSADVEEPAGPPTGADSV